MKILWVSPRIIGPAARIVDTDYKGTSGSWIQSEYEKLDLSNNEIIYLCGSKENSNGSIRVYKQGNETAYCIPLTRVSYGIAPSDALIKKIESVIKSINPDIIHIWGTETCLQDAVASCVPNIPKVVYIQGLIGMHFRYRDGYMSISDPGYLKFVSIKRYSIRTISNYFFKKQVPIEKSIITKSHNVITDNNFTKAYCLSFDKDVVFYNRNLRPADCFYHKKWYADFFDRHSIFTVFGGNAEKGLHQVLKALTILSPMFPDIQLRIPGNYSIDNNGRLLLTKASSSFERWMYNYILSNKLEQHIHFLGPQTREEMAENIAKCNVYVNPSCMEVHALSLREAMAVGAPCISTLCGSVAEYVKHGINGFIYRFEEYEVLAYYIKTLFESDNLCRRIGERARTDLIAFSSAQDNSLENIYKEVIENWEYV